MTPGSADICIAVCTRNRAQQLREAIQSLASLETSADYRAFLLIVDNASEDATKEVIGELQVAYPQLQMRSVYESNVGFAHARNRAVQEANCQWIAFFDDDQIAEPDWLVELWKSAQRNKVGCVGGAVRLKLIETNFEPGPFCRQLLGETDPEAVERQYGPKFEPGAGNLLVRQSVLEDSGGFLADHTGRGEDARLFARMRAKNHTAWFTPDAIVNHVILPQRNHPVAYRALARASSSRCGDLGWLRWGWRLPFVAIARLLVFTVTQLPRLCWFTLFGTQSQRVDHACRARFNFSRSVADLRYSLNRIFRREQQ